MELEFRYRTVKSIRDDTFQFPGWKQKRSVFRSYIVVEAAVRQEIQQDCSARGHNVCDGDGRPQGGTRTCVDATEEDDGLQQVDELSSSSAAAASPSSSSRASSRGWWRSWRRDAYRRDGEEHGAPIVTSHQEPSRRAFDERLDDDRRRRQRPRRGTAAHADTHVKERHLQRAATLVGRLLQTLLQAARETSGKGI